MNIEDIIRRAVAKTIIRNRAEKIWEQKKRLNIGDFDIIVEHPDINDNYIRFVSEDYFDTLFNTSEEVFNLLITESPDEIFYNYYGIPAEKPIYVKSMPYGIHLHLAFRDLQKTWPEFYGNEKPDYTIGHTGIKTHHGVYISNSGRLTPHFDQLMREHLARLNKACKEGVAEPEIERMAEEFEGYSIAKICFEDTTHHEIEHLHSLVFGTWFNKNAIDELISWLNHYVLGINLPISEEDKEAFKKVHEKNMGKENFEKFFELLRRTRTDQSSKVFGTYKKRRVLPMAILELGSFSGGDFNVIYNHFQELVDKVRKLEGEL